MAADSFKEIVDEVQPGVDGMGQRKPRGQIGWLAKEGSELNFSFMTVLSVPGALSRLPGDLGLAKPRQQWIQNREGWAAPELTAQSAQALARALREQQL